MRPIRPTRKARRHSSPLPDLPDRRSCAPIRAPLQPFPHPECPGNLNDPGRRAGPRVWQSSGIPTKDRAHGYVLGLDPQVDERAIKDLDVQRPSRNPGHKTRLLLCVPTQSSNHSRRRILRVGEGRRGEAAPVLPQA